MTGVDEGSAARRAGVKVGDQILAVNGQWDLSSPGFLCCFMHCVFHVLVEDGWKFIFVCFVLVANA